MQPLVCIVRRSYTAR